MNQLEQAPVLSDPAEVLSPPEHLAGPLGHIALADQRINEEYVADGLEKLEAIANGEAVPEDTRVHDIDAAHEAALLENEIFDAHVAALKENEIFDAHVAALKENAKREASKNPVVQIEQKVSQAETIVTPPPESPQELRKEASVLLSQTGVNEQISSTCTITKDVEGNLLILDDADAKIITPSADGTPKLTEYHYDADSGTLTIKSKHFSVLSQPSKYQETAQQGWQSYDEVITLPPAIAKRFGIEQVATSKT